MCTRPFWRKCYWWTNSTAAHSKFTDSHRPGNDRSSTGWQQLTFTHTIAKCPWTGSINATLLGIQMWNWKHYPTRKWINEVCYHRLELQTLSSLAVSLPSLKWNCLLWLAHTVFLNKFEVLLFTEWDSGRRFPLAALSKKHLGWKDAVSAWCDIISGLILLYWW